MQPSSVFLLSSKLKHKKSFISHITKRFLKYQKKIEVEHITTLNFVKNEIKKGKSFSLLI